MSRPAVWLVLLAMWFGAALLAAAVVAPAAFAVLPTRALAGALVGRVLPVLFLTGAALGLGLALATRRTTARASGVVMLACALVAQFAIAPRVHALRAEAGSTFDTLPPDAPARRSFGQWHAASVLLLGGAMVAALAGGAAVARDPLRPSPD